MSACYLFGICLRYILRYMGMHTNSVWATLFLCPHENYSNQFKNFKFENFSVHDQTKRPKQNNWKLNWHVVIRVNENSVIKSTSTHGTFVCVCVCFCFKHKRTLFLSTCHSGRFTPMWSIALCVYDLIRFLLPSLSAFVHSLALLLFLFLRLMLTPICRFVLHVSHARRPYDIDSN